MKKFLKLCLAVVALATMFGFASCSNGSSDDSTATGGGATAKEVTVTTKTITIGTDVFTYKTVDGEVDDSDENVTVDADGNITIKAAASENTLTISADGTKLTYKAGTKTYEATASEDDDSENSEPISFENKDDPTDKVETTTEEEEKKETTATTNSIVGSKYYNYGIDNNNGKIKIKVSTFTIDSTSAGTHKTLSTIIKNGAVTENNASGNTTFTYSVSGSTINITEDGKTMALAVGADNSLTDEMNHKFTKFDGEIYGLTAATDADNYSYTVLLLAKDGTGKFIVKRMKDGSEKGSTNDLTNITVNGTTMSCTSGEHTVTATFSDDKSTVTVNDGKNNPVLTKL